MAGLRARSSRRERLREDRAHLGRGDFRGEHMSYYNFLSYQNLSVNVILACCNLKLIENPGKTINIARGDINFPTIAVVFTAATTSPSRTSSIPKT